MHAYISANSINDTYVQTNLNVMLRARAEGHAHCNYNHGLTSSLEQKPSKSIHIQKRGAQDEEAYYDTETDGNININSIIGRKNSSSRKRHSIIFVSKKKPKNK